MNYWVDKDKLYFDCGCVFNINNNQVIFIADLHNPNHTINFNCPATYEIISKGLTQGVFQLCSPLGTTWCVKVKPDKLEHLAALGALLRPGCLESKDDKGISTTIHYERRKNNKEETPSYLPIVDKILSDTYNCLIYQEQAIEIAKECAGFTPNEADSLRRSMGKKDVEEMQKNKKLFIEKAKTFGVLTESQSIEVFDWIEASQRYSFNRAHALAYAKRGYITAYIKYHFTIQYYKEWLSNEGDRDEYVKLVNEAKLFDISVHCPDLRDYKYDFYSRKREIYFGLSNIKGIVKKDIDKLAEIFALRGWEFDQLGKSITWLQFLSVGLEGIGSKTAEGLIHSGSLDFFGIDRARLYYEYERWNRLSPKEKKVYTDQPSLEKLVLDIGSQYKQDYLDRLATYNTKKAKREASGKTYKTQLEEPTENQRLAKIREIYQELTKPIYRVADTVDSLIFAEENLLGVALTRHKTDEVINAAETATCIEVSKGRRGYVVLRVKIDDCRPYRCKNDTTMGFLKLSDKTGQLSAVIFKEYDEYQYLLTRGNLVFVSGELSKESFCIKRVYGVS